jgi:hypothetical protein
MKPSLGLFVLLGACLLLLLRYAPTSSSSERYTAVIVEPRKHRATQFVLTNILTNLDERWDVIFYHGTENGEWVRQIVEQHLSYQRHRITFRSLGVKNLTIRGYNDLLVSRSFNAQIPTETFLIFQTDSMICPKYRGRIYEYIGRYDYVGAPWYNNGQPEIGNGGFSLRRRSAMLDIISWYHYNGENEDIYFALGCADGIHRLPSIDKAHAFAIEMINTRQAFGVHKAWLTWDKKDATKEDPIGWRELCAECEGLETLRSLQGED